MAGMAPLVEPDAGLSRRETARYARQLLLPELRAVGQRRLKNARVLSIGVGGIGAVALKYLIAAGVGAIGAVPLTAGEPGLRPVVDRLRGRNPYVRLTVHEEPLDPNRARKLFPRYDLVLDGSGDRAASYVADYACAVVDRPLIWAAAGRAAMFWGGRGPRLHDAQDAAAAADAVPRAGAAVASADDLVPCAADDAPHVGDEVLWAGLGAVLATEAVKLIAGIGEPLLGRMLIHDPLGMIYRTEVLAAEPGPVEPVGVLSPVELRELLNAGAPIDLIDVREPYEWRISAIPGGRRVPMAQWLDGTATGSLRAGRRPVFYCRTGNRTLAVVAAVRRAGFAEAAHLAGGVNAWVNQVDPSQPTY